MPPPSAYRSVLCATQLRIKYGSPEGMEAALGCCTAERLPSAAMIEMCEDDDDQSSWAVGQGPAVAACLAALPGGCWPAV